MSESFFTFWYIEATSLSDTSHILEDWRPSKYPTSEMESGSHLRTCDLSCLTEFSLKVMKMSDGSCFTLEKIKNLNFIVILVGLAQLC